MQKVADTRFCPQKKHCTWATYKCGLPYRYRSLLLLGETTPRNALPLGGGQEGDAIPYRGNLAPRRGEGAPWLLRFYSRAATDGSSMYYARDDEKLLEKVHLIVFVQNRVHHKE